MLRSQDSGIFGTLIPGLGFNRARAPSRIIWVCSCLQPWSNVPPGAGWAGEGEPLGLTRTQFPFMKARTRISLEVTVKMTQDGNKALVSRKYPTTWSWPSPACPLGDPGIEQPLLLMSVALVHNRNSKAGVGRKPDWGKTG